MNNELQNNVNPEALKRSFQKFKKDLIIINDIMNYLSKSDVIYFASEIITIKEYMEERLEKRITNII